MEVSSAAAENGKTKTEKKQNCWEFKKCGREPGGANAAEFGVCPASTDTRLDGEHGGKNGGRACWVVAGTFCRGEVQGSFAQKCVNCISCDFYAKVRSEEYYEFKLSTTLLAKMR